MQQNVTETIAKCVTRTSEDNLYIKECMIEKKNKILNTLQQELNS